MASKRKVKDVEETDLSIAQSIKRAKDEQHLQTVSPHDTTAPAANSIASVLQSSDHHYSNTAESESSIFFNPPSQSESVSASESEDENFDAAKEDKEDKDDDEDKDHLIAKEGDIIGLRFEVIKEMGTGTFGKVYQCRDYKHNDIVALKCIRSINKYIESAKVETKILNSIYRQQRQLLELERIDKEYCVKLYTRVNHGPYYCMAFEPLGSSLLDVLKMNDFRGFPMSFVISIAEQLLEALAFMSKIEIVHTDLKLENILFVSPEITKLPISSPSIQKQHFFGRGLKYEDNGATPSSSSATWRPFGHTHVHLPDQPTIKIIDFGGANYLHNGRKKQSVVNTRQYRGPEVTLEVGWSFPSDVWSVGCMLAEIWTGELLFATHDNLEHLCMMEQLLGPFPEWMIRHSPVRRSFFHSDYTSRIDEMPDDLRTKLNGLMPLNEESYESGDFVRLLKRMLNLDPQIRVTPKDAMKDRFLTTSHRPALPI